MQPSEWITAGGLLGIFGLVWKVGRDNDNKIVRTYSRLDEIKKDSEEKFIRRDMCELQHRQVNENFDRMKETLTEIKTDIKEVKRILNDGYQ